MIKMTKPYFEFHEYTVGDMSGGVPKEFDPQGLESKTKMRMLDPYGFLFLYGDVTEKPIMYFHHAYIDSVRFNGFTTLGDDCLSPQLPSKHHTDMAQKDAIVTKPYIKVSNDPIEYVIQTENKYSKIQLFEDCCICKETDILDIMAKPLPFTIIDHGCVFQDRFQMIQPCMFAGYYEGKPVIGMGNYDRLYIPNSVKKDILTDAAYIYVAGHGIREDGRIESYLTTINYYGTSQFDGTSCGFYWLEGEEPIIVNDVKIDTEWVHLPYVDDGTVVYKEAVFHIGPKEIHFKGKWGSKGFTEKPRIERHGQSQVFGTWYEGKVPYNHKMFFTFNENMGAYDYQIKALGFKVVD